MQEDIAKYYNQRRTPTTIFKPRDKMVLDMLNI